MALWDIFGGKGADEKFMEIRKEEYRSLFRTLKAVAEKQSRISFEQGFAEDLKTNIVEGRDDALNKRKNARIEEYEKALDSALKNWNARHTYIKSTADILPFEKALLTRFANCEVYIGKIKSTLATHKDRHISKYRTAPDWAKAIKGELSVAERDLAFQCGKAISDI